MNIHKSKIDWCTHTWNPVTGCLHGCEYCYARRFIARFQPHATERPMSTGAISSEGGATGILESNSSPGCYAVYRPVKLCDETGEYTRSTPYPMGFRPTLNAFTLNYPEKRLIPSRIFVSSMGDLFGAWVPDNWIGAVMDSCKRAPQHTYLFLTKNPQRYYELAKAGKLPEDKNFWYGSTVTNPDMPFWWSEKHNTFVSVEPLLAPFEDNGNSPFAKVNWVIIGAQTGPGSAEHRPKQEWIDSIVAAAATSDVPVFMKGNLSEAWGRKLILEHPAGMVWPEDEGR